MPVLEARGVTKTYDQLHAVLNDVSFSVEPHEIVVLLGRSGSGKTTLLNVLSGLERPTSGHVLLEGTDLATLDEERRARIRLERIGIIFQRFHLISELTLEENVRLPMDLAGRPDVEERSRMLLDAFDLRAKADAFPSTLSGGEVQRAAIARALGNDPKVLLADEPTANLDRANAENALAALRDVAQRFGSGVVVATHDPLAASIGHRVLEMADGRVRPLPKGTLTAGLATGVG